MSLPSVSLTCLVALVSILFVYAFRERRRQPLPPGPRGLPFFGNFFDLPDKDQWQVFLQWSRELSSPVISLSVMGNVFVVLNDFKTAQDLLLKRSATYSGRPRMPMLTETSDFDWDWGFTSDTARWKYSRREFNTVARSSVSRRYREKESAMTQILLHKLLVSPENFMEHLRYIVGGLMLDICYGIKIKMQGDDLVDMSDISTWGLEASHSGSITNIFPWLQRVPSCLSWIPGLRWKAKMEEFKRWGYSMRDVPYARIKSQLDSGTAPISMTTGLLGALQDRAPDHDRMAREDFVKGLVGTAHIGGSDTTTSVLRFFILAMVVNPDVQRRAQQEIDNVVGPARLPQFSDEAHLPYIKAICKELIRWTSPSPVAHSNAIDDDYTGYRIPKGSFVLSNTWAILHDPTAFPGPEAFKPERFLTQEGELDPKAPDISSGFGYGRRICPGRFIALDMMWISIASILATFNVTHAIASDGRPVIPPVDINHGLLNRPKSFKCEIKPRSEQAVRLIRNL